MENKQELKLVKKGKRVIELLRSLGLDFNDIFILECFKYQEDREFFDLFSIPSLKDINLSIRFQTLRRLEYIVEDPKDISKHIISIKGKDLLTDLSLPDNISSASIVMINMQISDEEKFEEWWKIFPTTVGWSSEDKTIKFIGSRNLKNIKKADAKKRYLKLLNQGLPHKDLIGGLKTEIKLKKIDSIKKNTNQMEYFKGMDSYFNSERYLLFIETYKENTDFVNGEDSKITSKKINVVDI